MVYLERSETLSFDQDRIADAQILKGNVRFRHDDALMYCDSAYFYETTNSLDAFGHVRFEQGDTLQGFCDRLYYNGNTKLARMRRHVRMVHGREQENPTVLTTDSLNYDRARGVAYYYSGGVIQDSLNTLTSVRGQYVPNTKQALFRQEVHLTNPNFVLTSDTLIYHTDTKVANIVSPTTILYEEKTTITTSRGWYNTDSEQSMLLDRSLVKHNDGKSMTGDTIYYDKKIGFGKVLGHMEMRDTAQRATLYGEYGQMYEEYSRGYATDSAADSTYRRVRAHHKARIYRDDMQMVCDSMVYLGSDSTIHLYTTPICWNNNQQIAADSIVVYIVNGAVDHAVGAPNAICVLQDTLDIFDQMSGKEITAYLTDGEVHTIDVSGNALTIYYPRDEEDGSYYGRRGEQLYPRVCAKPEYLPPAVHQRDHGNPLPARPDSRRRRSTGGFLLGGRHTTDQSGGCIP